MMRQYLVKIAAPALLFMSLHSTGFAQDNDDHDTTADKLNNYDEIIIKRKSDKDAKVSVEIKDGQILINGKPVSEYEDDNLSVHKRKIRIMNGDGFSFSQSGDGDHDLMIAPDVSIFRNGGGVKSFRGGDWGENSNRAFLGVSSEKSEDNAEGAKIREVTKGSAAEKAGLQKGDVITKIDETKIEEPEQLSETVRKYKPADKITLTYKRAGKELKTTATLGKSRGNSAYNFNYNYTVPPVPPMPPINLEGFGRDSRPRLGIKAQDTEDGKGVKVLDVDDESSAAKAGIKEGDIITRFDGKEVNSAMSLAEVARDSRGKISIKIGLTRDGKAQEVEVKVPRRLRTTDL